MIAVIIIVALLIGSAAIIYFCSIKSLKLKTKYPHLECFKGEGFIEREYGNGDEANPIIDYDSL